MALATTGITTSLVGTTLGTSARHVSGLCTDEGICPWSKWKPIQSAAATMTDAILKDQNYGISIITANSPDQLLTAVRNNGNKGYVYHRPTAGQYRLGDFRNYEHNAFVPARTTYQDGDVQNIGGVTSTNKNSYKKTLAGLESMDGPSGTGLGVNDIYHPADIDGAPVTLRRGALVTDGTNTYWSTDYIPWGETQWQKFLGKSVTILEFYTNAKNNTENLYDANFGDIFMALPFPLASITASSNALPGSRDVACNATAEFTFPGEYYSIDYSVYFTAPTDVYTGGTIRNVYITLATDAKGMNPVVSHKIADSITVAKYGQSPVYTGTLSSYAGTSMLYALIYWNNQLQYTTMVFSLQPQL